MPTTQIVTLAPEEWQPYRELRLRALATDPQAFGGSYADALQQPASYWQGRLAEAQADAQGRQHLWLLFAREAERLVGMIGALAGEDPTVVQIIAVYVSPESRGQGLGNLLMTAILAEVAKKGTFTKAILGVNSAQEAAVALYRSFGFDLVREELVTRAGGEVRRGYWMEKWLV